MQNDRLLALLMAREDARLCAANHGPGTFPDMHSILDCADDYYHFLLSDEELAASEATLADVDSVEDIQDGLDAMVAEASVIEQTYNRFRAIGFDHATIMRGLAKAYPNWQFVS